MPSTCQLSNLTHLNWHVTPIFNLGGNHYTHKYVAGKLNNRHVTTFHNVNIVA